MKRRKNTNSMFGMIQIYSVDSSFVRFESKFFANFDLQKLKSTLKFESECSGKNCWLDWHEFWNNCYITIKWVCSKIMSHSWLRYFPCDRLLTNGSSVFVIYSATCQNFQYLLECVLKYFRIHEKCLISERFIQSSHFLQLRSNWT